MKATNPHIPNLFVVLTICMTAAVSSAHTWNVERIGDTIGGTPKQIEVSVPNDAEWPGVLEMAVGPGTYPIRYWFNQYLTWDFNTVSDETNRGHMGFAHHPTGGVPHVAYGFENKIYLAWLSNDGPWLREVAFEGDAGGVSLAFNVEGWPGLAVAGSGALTYVWKDELGWHNHQIATNHGGFNDPSLAYDPNTGLPWISYGRCFRGIEVTSANSFDYTSWSIEEIEQTSFPDQTELRFVPGSGDLVVMYLTGWGENLRLAVCRNGLWQPPEDIVSGPWHDSGVDVDVDGTVYVAWGEGQWGSMGLYLKQRDWATGQWTGKTLITTEFPTIMNSSLDVSDNRLGQREVHIVVDGGYINRAWAIVGGPAASILLLDPNGGESLVAGSKYDIRGESSGPVPYVLLEYSANNGLDWKVIGVTSNISEYHWEIPQENSQECLIRISYPPNPLVSDTSDNLFTIYQCTLAYDLNHDCFMDFLDFALLGSEWLQCGNPFDPNCVQ